MKAMKNNHKPEPGPLWSTALRCFVLLTLLTGAVYPLALTGLSQLLMPAAANGSMLSSGEKPSGSELLGQSFDAPGQFWGRLSQTAEKPYNSAASGASNLGTSNPALADNAKARLEALNLGSTPVPVDLVTSSASGLDPHISPEAARVQISRVAAATGKSPQALEALVARLTEPATFGILGRPRVNVGRLNSELLLLP